MCYSALNEIECMVCILHSKLTQIIYYRNFFHCRPFSLARRDLICLFYMFHFILFQLINGWCVCACCGQLLTFASMISFLFLCFSKPIKWHERRDINTFSKYKLFLYSYFFFVFVFSSGLSRALPDQCI